MDTSAKVIRPSQGVVKKRKIAVGDRYGKLVVEEYKGVGRNHNRIWNCRCDCGNTKDVEGYFLSSGATKHCGCDWKANKRTADLIGQRFGSLLVVERIGSRRVDWGVRVLWKCQCDCGNIYETWTSRLRNGETKSCGCSRPKNAAIARGFIKQRMALPPGQASLHDLCRVYRYGARRRDIAFELTDEAMKILFDSPCCYCGRPPHRSHTGSKSKHGYIYTGIDRKDNSKGYTSENSVPCCTDCNRAKLKMSEEDFMKWISMVYHNLVKRKAA